MMYLIQVKLSGENIPNKLPSTLLNGEKLSFLPDISKASEEKEGDDVLAFKVHSQSLRSLFLGKIAFTCGALQIGKKKLYWSSE